MEENKTLEEREELMEELQEVVDSDTALPEVPVEKKGSVLVGLGIGAAAFGIVYAGYRGIKALKHKYDQKVIDRYFAEHVEDADDLDEDFDSDQEEEVVEEESSEK